MAFLTLFLGLVTGAHPLQLTVVDPQVARIEILLDGGTVSVLSGAPWTATADFGAALAPHELEAVAFDKDGHEVSRARQWINMPRDRAEVELVLEGDPDGRVDQAHMVWSSVDVAHPETARVFLDGNELEGIDPQRFPLPRYDATIPHLLQAEVQLGDTTARAQTVVGGGSGSALSRALSAFPVYLEDGRLPTPTEIRGWIEVRGQGVRIVAVERPGVDVLMVQDLAWYLQKRLKGVRNEMLQARISARKRPTGLKSKDHFRLLFPIPEDASQAAVRSLHFPMSPNLWSGQLIETHAQGAVDRQVAEPIPQGLMVGIPVNGERQLDTSNQHLTDAVAVAALAAVQGQRARVLLLVAGSDEQDHSRYSPAQVRSYLADLNVPLRVWSPEPDKVDPDWGEVENISTRNRLERAIRELRDFLDHQAVIWIEGLHLPHQIRLGSAADGRLKRITDVGPPLPESDEDYDLDPGLRVADLPAELTGERLSPSVTEAGREATTEETASNENTKSDSLLENETFAEAVEVNVVNVDVVVTAKDGSRVRNLDRDDFRLHEDGERVEITYFEAPPTATEAPELGSSPDLDRQIPVARPMSLIVYLDLFRLTMKQRSQALKALAAEFATERDKVRVMLMVNDGSVEIPLTFTEDRTLIRRVIADLENRKPRVYADDLRNVYRDIAEVRSAIRYAHGLPDEQAKRAALSSALSRRQAVDGNLPLIAQQQKRDILDLVANLEDLASALSGVDGRKAILYLGNRISMSPGEALFAEAASTMADYSTIATQVAGYPEDSRQTRLLSEVSRLKISKDFTDMIRETSATGVTFYTLTPPSNEDADLASRETIGTTGRAASARNDATKEAACVMSGDTGGLCQVGGTEMTLLLDQTFDDFSAYYSLAFTPTHPSDGEFHTIEVEIDRADLDVRYREGYLDRAREDAVRDRLIAALTFGEEQDELGMSLVMESQQQAEVEGLILIPFEVRIPAQQLALVPLPGGEKRRSTARLLVTTMDHRGNVTGVQEYPIRFEVRESRLASGQPLVYAHKVHLSLAPGEQTLAVGIWDDIGRVGSFFRRTLDVGAP